nr:PIN domain-containing protein [Candidatus Freyrarchaeum guaymaensis]
MGAGLATGWPNGVESSDVGLRGYPESPIRGACLDDGETPDRPTTFTHKNLSSVNPVPIPLKVKVLRDGWRILEKHHIYVADAIQVSSAKHVQADILLTGDKKLHDVALKEEVRSELL